MKRTIIAFGLLVVITASFLLARIPRLTLPAARPIAITHVTVVNPTGPPLTDVTVFIQGDRVASITVSDSSRLPSGVVTIDARGKYLIPGMWDMHMHGVFAEPSREFVQPLLIAYGVTGVRVMTSELTVGQIGYMREPSWQPAQLMPRTVTSGRSVNGPSGVSKTSIVIRSASDGAAAVDSVLRSGGEFIKVFNNVPRDAYSALMQMAHARGVRVAGHLPSDIDASVASDAGQAIEHVTMLLRGCSSREAELRDSLVASRGKPGAANVERRTMIYASRTFDEARCKQLAQRFAANRTWVDPTLTPVFRKTVQGAADSEGLAYVPGGMRGFEEMHRWSVHRTAAERENAELLWRRASEIVTILHTAGVPLLTGTDAIAPSLVPGITLHTELALLVRAGLTPQQALFAATQGPSEYFGVSDTLGTITQGKIADLVLLSANPLADIRNTRKIDTVILRGRMFERSALDAILEQTARRARRESLALAVQARATSAWCAVAQSEKCRKKAAEN